MSRTFAVSIRTIPQLKSQNLNHILVTKQSQNNHHLNTLFLFSCTRITCSIFVKTNHITKLHIQNNNNNNNNNFNILVRELTNIRTSFGCFGYSPLSLFHLQRSCSSSRWVSVMSQKNDLRLTPPQESTKTVRCVIKGRVQGVFYRNWTIENATQLGLKGWVRNRRDGSVEALFSGKTEAVDEMMQRCQCGPPGAMVTAFQANPCNDDPGTEFERRPTV